MPADPIQWPYEMFVGAAATGGRVPDPAHYGEAMRQADSAEWIEAMEQEAQAIVINDTFSLVQQRDITPGAKPLRTRFVYARKYDASGACVRHKARLVADGSRQHGMGVAETFAPVSTQAAIRVMTALAAHYGLCTRTVDIKNAYLEAPIDKETFIQLPASWPAHLGNTADGDGPVYARLNKGLYGLRKAGQLFNTELNAHLEAYGLRRCLSDPCCYVLEAQEQTVLWLTCHVDDCLIWAVSDSDIDNLVHHLEARFQLRDLGKTTFALGIEFDFGDGYARLAQTAYVEQMLERYGLSGCNPVGTPLVPNTHLAGAEDGAQLLGDEQHKLYQQLVGSLQYASICTRPDISAAVGQLSRQVARPTQEHLDAARHVLKYLSGTKTMGITYRRSSTPFELVAWCDANFAPMEHGSRSTTGLVMMLGGAAVYWRSVRQGLVSLSSCEAEYGALTEAARECLWLRGLLAELGVGMDGATTIMEDNTGTMAIASTPVTNGRSKHIALRVNFVRQHLRLADVKLQHCATRDQCADLLTKQLPKPQHMTLRDLVMGAGKKK